MFNPNAFCRRGLMLVELLMVLAIGAMLLTATASALFAAADSIRDNQAFVLTSQRARLATSNMARAVRTSTRTRLSPDGKALYVQSLASDQLTHEWRAYLYDSAGKRLLVDSTPPLPPQNIRLSEVLARTSGPAPSAAAVLGGVTALQFDATSALRVNPDDAISGTAETTIVSLHIRLTVAYGGTAFTADESVVPRRAAFLETVN